MSRKSNRVARVSGLALAGAGLAHFTSPRLWEPITKSAFPRNTRQHVYTNGGIETVLGLGFEQQADPQPGHRRVDRIPRLSGRERYPPRPNTVTSISFRTHACG